MRATALRISSTWPSIPGKSCAAFLAIAGCGYGHPVFPPRFRLVGIVACVCTSAFPPLLPAEQQDPGNIGSTAELPIPSWFRAALDQGTREPSGHPGPGYWQIRTSYRISVTLDELSHRLTGNEVVTLYNDSPDTLQRIVVRIDQNLFRDEFQGLEPTDGVSVHSVSINGTRLSSGNDGGVGWRFSSDNETLATINLPGPLAAGDSLNLGFEWSFELPAAARGSNFRMGRDGDVYQVGQWYPRIAMYDDLHGWDTTAYDGQLEFYNPFGRFVVEVTAPGNWIVGATGTLVNSEEVLSTRTLERLTASADTDALVTIAEFGDASAGLVTTAGDRLTWRFEADSVSDFAWGASPNYAWKAVRVVLPDGKAVAVHLLPTRESGVGAATAAAVKRAMIEFSRLAGSYPFPQHTLIDGPEGGMEYPMLTMSHFDSRLRHEIAHQWWPVQVGSNENWYAFMDEGLAGYFAGLTSADRPESVGSGGRSTQVPLIWPDDRGRPDWRTAVYGYSVTGRMLRALSNEFGEERVVRALGEYTRAWRFKHPSPWDFMSMMANSLGADLDSYWMRWIFSPIGG